MLRVKLQKLISVSQVGGLALSVTPNGVPPLPKGEARNVPVTPLALPLKDFPRSGEDVAQRQKGDKLSPKVTERARPLPMLAELCRTPHEGCKTGILFPATMLYCTLV